MGVVGGSEAVGEGGRCRCVLHPYPETHDMIRYFVPDWFVIRPIYVYK